MDLLKLTNSYLNLNLTINKILFRARYEPKKEAELKRQVADLDYVRETLNILAAENRVLERRLLEIHEENLRLKKQIQEINDQSKEMQDL